MVILRKLKNILRFLIILIIFSCSQDPVEIFLKGENIYDRDFYERTIKLEENGSYTTSPDGRKVRDLRSSSYSTNDKTEEAYQREKAKLEKEEKSTNSKGAKAFQSTIYIVATGDTLYGIANKKSVSASDIIRINNLQEPYALRVGQKLQIPGGSTAVSYYTVKPGDNILAIAKKYNTDAKKLADQNNISKPYIINVGQKLKIAGSAASVVSAYKPAEESTEKPTAIVSNIGTPTLIVNKVDNKANKFMKPIKGDVISKFGKQSDGSMNDGITIKAAEGSDFKAAEDGVVAYVGNQLKGYGTLILIKHSNKFITAYAHCQSVSIKRGDKVAKGQIIGKVGKTGNVEEPQLYFSIRKGRKAVDPINYIN